MASRIRGWPGPFVGAGLLAMAALRCACQTAPSASQASQLPQVRHGQLNPRLAMPDLWERAKRPVAISNHSCLVPEQAMLTAAQVTG